MWRGGGRGDGAARALLRLLLLAGAALLGAPHRARAAPPPARPCPPCPPHAAATACQQNNQENLFAECFYKVNNESLVITTSTKYYSLTCPEGVRLNSTSLPRFSSAVRVPEVTFISCPLPDEPYAAVLQRLNVRVVDSLALSRVPPGALRDDHFHDLRQITRLVISQNRNEDSMKRNNNSNVNLTTLRKQNRYENLIKTKLFARNLTLAPLRQLTELHLEGLPLLFGLKALENLTSLETLKLYNCRLVKLHTNQLCRLPALKKIYIRDEWLGSLLTPDSSCNITTVSLVARRLTIMPSFHAVQALTLQIEMQNVTISECSLLENLTIINNNITTLPDGWLNQCHQLKRLTLSLARLSGPLTRGALAGARALQELKLTGSAGIKLTDSLFETTRTLKILNLSKNKLKELPSGVFSLLLELEVLELSDNELHAGALLELNGLPRLRRLVLDDNPLGDLCDPGTDTFHVRILSPLHPLTALQELRLARTGAARLCSDWRRGMHQLNKLYLDQNNITRLEWEDLRDWNRDVEVNLNDSGLTTIWMDKTNYEDPGTYPGTVKFRIGSKPLRCDCSIYWFARAMKEHLLSVTFDTIHCSRPSSDTDTRTSVNFVDFDLDLMVCPIPDNCPEGCYCMWHPKNESVLIECSHIKLGVLPDVTALERELKNDTEIMLRVNSNKISVLPDSLSARVSKLDVRNNSVRAVGAAAARALLDGGRRVWLAGNPLDCSCGQPLRHEIRTHIHQIMDVDEARCADGGLLRDALTEECGGERGAVWAACGAVAALLLAAVAAAALQRPVRLRLKAFLLARGLCLRWVLPDDDDDCTYDAFLSYAHEDAAAAAALLAALERGPRALRLCVHHRDWRPGEWIPAQIAQSVRDSRRTIILLSENFAKSSWARAEFREAYAHALRDDAVRLVVVLLGDAPPADLDPDIGHYVANNTYVRWGEPAFLEKLRLALPAGRLRPPPLHTERKQKTQSSPAKAKCKTSPAALAPAAACPAPARARPAPLAVDIPAYPMPPQPPTPVVKFAHIDFPAPLKPAKNVAPPCA